MCLDPIKLIISYLRSAIKSKNHRYLGFSLSELINGLRLIAQNDVNTQIVRCFLCCTHDKNILCELFFFIFKMS